MESVIPKFVWHLPWLQIDKLFSICDFLGAKNSGKLLIIIIYYFYNNYY